MISAVIRNRCFNKHLGQTPYYLMAGRKPDLSKMREFGWPTRNDPGVLDEEINTKRILPVKSETEVERQVSKET